MKTICAWCGDTIQEGEEEEESHGICEDCKKKEFDDRAIGIRYSCDIIKTPQSSQEWMDSMVEITADVEEDQLEFHLQEMEKEMYGDDDE